MHRSNSAGFPLIALFLAVTASTLLAAMVRSIWIALKANQLSTALLLGMALTGGIVGAVAALFVGSGYRGRFSIWIRLPLVAASSVLPVKRRLVIRLVPDEELAN